MTTSHNRVAVLHGVNFNILDRRDPAVYGGLSLRELETKIERWAHELGLEPIFFQTNSEGEFCEYLHRVPEMADSAIVNAGAWSHYSRAIADALGRDKKRTSAGVGFVLLAEPGQPRTGQLVAPDDLRAAVEELYG